MTFPLLLAAVFAGLCFNWLVRTSMLHMLEASGNAITR